MEVVVKPLNIVARVAPLAPRRRSRGYCPENPGHESYPLGIERHTLFYLECGAIIPSHLVPKINEVYGLGRFPLPEDF